MFNRNGDLLDGVKIDRNELLKVLKENKEKHVIDVAEAMALRRDEIISYFTDSLERMNRDSTWNPKEKINFPMPADHSADYEKAIRMVTMTQETIIELDENQFDKLVMDNWDWKQELISTSAIYGKQF